MTDIDLIRASRAGDKAALEALDLCHPPSVWRYAYCRMGGDWHAAEDVVSETFLAVVRALGRFDPERGSFGPWLIGIAGHKATDQRRRAGKPGAPSLSDAEACASAAGQAPPTAAEAAETRATVAAIVNDLADDERLSLEWKYIDKLSVREIAERLGRTEKAAEALLFRARCSFRALAEESRRNHT